jgi:hypothetical protein
MNPLVAILLGLAVLVIGTLGYFQIYGSASSNANAQNTSQVIQAIFSNVASNFANNPTNFTGFDNTDAIQAAIVPSSWIPPGQTTTILDPWGGAVTFAPVSIANGNNNGWSMTLASVPQAVCAQVATYYTPQTDVIGINGREVASNPTYGGSLWPPAPASIQAKCLPKTNTIIWDVSGQ